MEQNQLEELSLEMAKVYGISQEQAVSTIRIVLQTSLSLAEAIRAISERIERVVAGIWKELKEFNNQLESEQYIHNKNKHAWSTVWDTRKKSQILSNKPRFMVRKIIG